MMRRPALPERMRACQVLRLAFGTRAHEIRGTTFYSMVHTQSERYTHKENACRSNCRESLSARSMRCRTSAICVCLCIELCGCCWRRVRRARIACDELWRSVASKRERAALARFRRIKSNLKLSRNNSTSTSLVPCTRTLVPNQRAAALGLVSCRRTANRFRANHKQGELCCCVHGPDIFENLRNSHFIMLSIDAHKLSVRYT